MDKKKKLILSCTVIIALNFTLVIILGYINHKGSNSKTAISEVNLQKIDDLMIGAEPPKLLYADKEKVIFDCRGVYVYDLKNKAIAKSFDTSTLVSDKHMKLNCFATQDGKQILFGVINGMGELESRYGYSFESDSVRELTEEEYKDYRTKAFLCTNVDYNDQLYEKSFGRIANISKNVYVYLTFKDWKVSTIKAVYVENDKETGYSIFERN